MRTLGGILMDNSRRISIFFILSLTVWVGRAAGQSPPLDGTLAPGQNFQGRIAFPGDTDRVVFDALRGSRVTVVVSGVRGARVRPRATLWKDGVAIELSAPQVRTRLDGHKQRLIDVLVEETGTFEVTIIGAAGSLGDYHLRVRERLRRQTHGRMKLGGGEVRQIPFSARAGADAMLVLVKVDKSAEPLMIPRLRAPNGTIVSLDDVTTSSHGGRRLRIGPIAFFADGDYEVLVSSIAAQVVRYKLRVNGTPPAGSSLKESSGHSALNGSITLNDGYWLSAQNNDEFGEEGSFIADELLVRVRPGTDRFEVASRLGCAVEQVSPGGWCRLRRLGTGRSQAAAASSKGVTKLCSLARQEDGVQEAQPNRLRTAFGVPTDPLYPQQWDIKKAGFEGAWAIETGDLARTVAVLDTGIRFDHPDLAGRLAPGFDFVGDGWNAGDGDGIDTDPTDPFVSMGTHGTHVSGTLAAATNNNLGVAGGTLAGQVMPIRVLGILGGTDFDIAQGILYASGLPNASGLLPPSKAEVINMSLGGPTDSAILHEAVRDAVAAGVVVVAAAGNANSTTPMYPAAFPEVIAVGATDAGDNRAPYSSYGPHLALAAPGGDRNADLDGDGEPDGILSTVVDPIFGAAYARKTGTSMASPHVAAAAFLLRSAHPGLTPREVEAYLEAGAMDLGLPGWDEKFGFGRIDAGHSLVLAGSLGTGPDEVFFTPHVLTFSADGEVNSFAVVNKGGGGPIGIASVVSDRFWLHPVDLVGQSPGTFRVRVDTAGMAPGTYLSSLHISASTGAFDVPVQVAVGAADGPIGIDKVYVFAVDMVDKKPVAMVAVIEENADLFVMDPLPEGTYRLVATTDLDHDGIAGESHDYAGLALDPVTGKGKLIMPDGIFLAGLSIALTVGGSGSLPGGGNYTVMGQ